jgi:hypothetical protein
MAEPDGRRKVTLYMAEADAEALTSLLEELHYETRLSKVDVLSAVVAVAGRRRPEILARLNRHAVKLAGVRRPGNGRVSA